MAIQFLNTVAVDTDVLYVDATNNRVGIGTTSPLSKAHIIDTSNPNTTSGSLIVEGRRDGGANVLTLRAKDASNPSNALPNGQGVVMRFQGFDGTDFENMGYIFTGADGQAVANSDAPSFMSFGTSADGSSSPLERMRITSTGNVGIGESNPIAVSSGATTLTIKGTTTTKAGALLLRSSDNSVSSYIYPDSTNGLTLGSLSNHDVRFIANGAERMRIDSSGVVQVRNVDSPTLQLFNTDTSLTANQVIGDIDFYQSDPSGGGVGVVSKIRSINSSSFQGEAGLAFHTGTASGLTERLRIGSSGQIGIGGANYGTSGQVLTSSGSGSAPSWQNAGAASSNWTLSGNDIYNNNSGNVGIGTSSPDTKLTIENASAGPASPTYATTASNANLHLSAVGVPFYNHLFMGIGSATYAWIQAQHGNGVAQNLALNPNGGNVGIGTTSPLDLLHIKSSTTDARMILDGASGFDAELKFYEDGNSKYTVGYDSASANFVIGTTNVDTNQRLVINSSGNVGIGTTSPTNVLHAHSDTDNDYVARFEGSTNNTSGVWTGIGIGGESNNTKSAIIFEDIGLNYSRGKLHLAVNNEQNQNSATKADARLTVNNNGNVGIGITSPTNYKLEVNGSVRGDSFGTDQNTTARIFAPSGAAYNGNSNQTGYLIMQLPDNAAFGINNMMSGVIRVFDYAQSESFDVRFSGYWYAGYNWTACTAYVVNEPGVERNFRVSFGRSTGASGSQDRPYIAIGDATSVWTYCKFSVIEYTSGHSNANLDRWNSGWAASLSSTLPGSVIATVSNTQTNNWKRASNNLYSGNSGNVGIGTTSPGNKLSVLGTGRVFNATSSNDEVVASITRSGSGAISTLGFNANGSTSDYHVRIGANTTSFVAYTSNVERMRINSSGNVGIGTTSPGALLEIKQGVQGGLTLPLTINPGFYQPGTSSGIGFLTDGLTSYTKGALVYTTNGGGWNVGDFQFLLRNDNNQNLVTLADAKMTIKANGSVGIGTALPGNKLSIVTPPSGDDILPALGANAGKLSLLNNNGAYGLLQGVLGTGSSFIQSQRVDGIATAYSLLLNPNGGNIGIGATGVFTNNHILNLSGTGIAIKNDTNGSSNNWSTIKNTATSSGSNLVFQTASGTIVMDNSGNVGIGTTGPGEKLAVSGNQHLTGDLRLGASSSATGTGIVKSSSGVLSLFTWGDATNIQIGGSDVIFKPESGSERMRITSAGNVGIGTTTFPTTAIGERELLVQGAIVSKPPGVNDYYSYLKSNWAYDSAFELGIQGAGTNHKFITSSNYYYGTQLNFHTSDQKRMVIDTNGDVGIGTTSPGAKLHVYADGKAAIIRSNQNVGLEVQGGGNGTDIAIFKNTSGTERFSLNDGGQMFNLGMASSSSANASLMHNSSTGLIYRYTSSIRYKEDVKDLTNAVDKIMKLRPVEFKPKDSLKYTTGMIAEEVFEVMPEITFEAEIEGFDKPQVDGISYEPLHAYYIKAIQELSIKIEQLETRIQTLENN